MCILFLFIYVINIDDDGEGELQSRVTEGRCTVCIYDIYVYMYVRIDKYVS
jgi:hypothetical protein